MEILCCGITVVHTSKCPQILSLKNNNVFFFNPNPSLLTVSAIPSNKKKQLTLRCQSSKSVEEQDGFSGNSEKTHSSKSLEGLPPQFYVRYSIYKEEAALKIEPNAPEFVPVDSGSFKLKSRGFVLLQFAPSVGDHQYDWSKMEVFALSVTEIGAMIALGPSDSCELCHDSFMGQSEEGKMRKVLKAEPLPDGSGHVFNLSVRNKFLDEDEISISIPITKAELVVIVSGFNFILPHLLGWGAFVDSIKPGHNAKRIIKPRRIYKKKEQRATSPPLGAN